MPKRWKIGGAALLILIGLILWESNRAKEPRYKGESLSFWLAGDGCTDEETKEAIDHLGTNCVPALLQMLQTEDSTAKQKLAALTDRQNLFRIRMADAEEKHFYAIHGFSLLGVRARGAVGVLLKLYEESSNSPEQKRRIAAALGAIGSSASEAIPALLRAMSSTNETVSESAASTLADSGFDPRLVVPGLTNALSDPNELTRMLAANSISHFGSNAASAVPALVVAARDTDRNVRLEAINALGSVHSDPQLAVPALTKALKDTQYRARAGAALALAEYGTNAVSAIPLLIELSAEDLVADRNSAINALGTIHSRPEIILPLLTNALTDNEESTRLAAAVALGNFGNEAKSACPALIDLYRRESQTAEGERLSSYRTEGIEAALLKIDPTAAAQAGVKTTPHQFLTGSESSSRRP